MLITFSGLLSQFEKVYKRMERGEQVNSSALELIISAATNTFKVCVMVESRCTLYTVGKTF